MVVENLVQDRLGHATFGLITALSALTLVVAALSDLGLTPYSVQRVAAEPTFMAETFPTLLPLRGALNAVALAAMLAVGWVLGYRGSELVLLGAIGTALLLAQYGQFLRGTLQAHQKFNTDAVLSVVEKFLLLGAVLVLIPLGLTLPRYVGVRLGAAAATTVLLYGLMTHFFGRVRYRWKVPVARTALRASLPFALMTLLYGVNERIDMVMLERLASPTEAGYYAGAYRWVDAVMMYAWTVLPLFFAKFASVPRDALAQRQLLWFGQRVLSLPRARTLSSSSRSGSAVCGLVGIKTAVERYTLGSSSATTMLTSAANATAPATKYFQRLIMGPRPTSEKEGADIQRGKPPTPPS